MISYFVRLLARRSYRYLVLSFGSLLVSGFLFGAVISITQTVSSYLISEGKVLMGGDISFSSQYPIDLKQEPFATLQKEGHTFSETQSLQAVFLNEDKTKSGGAEVRIVGKNFPLYGAVTLGQDKIFSYIANALYAEQGFLDKLGVSVGDRVFLGNVSFIVSGIIVKEPDNLATGIAFSPRVLIFREGISGNEQVFLQSRTQYRVYVKENSSQAFTKDRIESLRQIARDNRLRFDDATDGPNNLVRGFSSVDNFIGIVLSVAFFLVVINIVSNLVYLLSRFRKTIALLKIYGATTKQIRYIFVTLFSFLGFVAGGIGTGVGVVVSKYVLAFLSARFLISLESTYSATIIVLGALFGVCIMLLSSIPFLSALAQVHPKELLEVSKRHLTSLPFIRTVLLYLPLPVFLFLTLWYVTSEWTLSLYAVLICGGLFALFMGSSYSILRALYSIRERFSFLPHSIVSFLYLRGVQTATTIAAIMVAFCGVFIISAIEKNIEVNLAKNVTRTAPSLYLVDITKSQREEVRRIVGESFTEYPIVRGRLVSFNGVSLLDHPDPGIRREFNFTYRDQLIEGETMYQGKLNDTQNGSVDIPVSIDKAFGEEIGDIKIGDKLEIFIQGITFTATITSIREVDSQRGIPFFYLVFPPSFLETFPASYFGTAEVSDLERVRIERELATTFSNVIPINTKVVIETLTKLLENMTLIVTLVGIPSILLGVFLILVMLWQAMYERSRDALLLRVFGLVRRKVVALFILESVSIVMFSGLVAYGVAHILAYAVNVYLFSFTTFAFATLPLYLLLGKLTLVILFAYVLAYSITRTSLKKLLAGR